MKANETQVAVTLELALKQINSLDHRYMIGLHNKSVEEYINLLCAPYEGEPQMYRKVCDTINGMLLLKEFQLKQLINN
jgi:hypothetical protein